MYKWWWCAGIKNEENLPPTSNVTNGLWEKVAMSSGRHEEPNQTRKRRVLMEARGGEWS